MLLRSYIVKITDAAKTRKMGPELVETDYALMLTQCVTSWDERLGGTSRRCNACVLYKAQRDNDFSDILVWSPQAPTSSGRKVRPQGGRDLVEATDLSIHILCFSFYVVCHFVSSAANCES